MNSSLASSNLFSELTPIEQFSASDIEKAQKRFEHYVHIGVIQDTKFDDEIWHFYDEYNNLNMYFNLQEFQYAKYYLSIFGITCKTMKSYIKCFVVQQLGQNVLDTIRDTINDISELLRTNPEELDVVAFRRPAVLFDFVELLPIVDEDAADAILTQIEICAEVALSEYKSAQRNLASFGTYFLLNDILDAFWEGNLSEDERLFFYPLYLWWRITSILPLRPREFILTPRNCLCIKDGKHCLTVRRNNLKGSNRRVHYNINNDYKLETYEIPKKLYDLIEGYIEKTNLFSENTLDTLFRAEPHYKRFHHKKPYTSRFYTYINLACCLRIFYSDIISTRLGYKPIQSQKGILQLNDMEIEYVHLADTRHVAMINLILQGGTPVMAMLLAGHADITMSSHYYSNISNLVECQTYSMYQKKLGRGEHMVLGQNFQVSNIESLGYAPLENNGRCYSTNFQNNDYSDCTKAAGENGEIGHCYSCPYYRNSDLTFFTQANDMYRQRIDASSKLLKYSIENYRKGLGYVEDINEALIKLQSASSSYRSFYLQSKYHNKAEEDIHGTK